MTLTLHTSFAKNQNWSIETSLAKCQTRSDVFYCSKSNLGKFKHQQPLESEQNHDKLAMQQQQCLLPKEDGSIPKEIFNANLI